MSVYSKCDTDNQRSPYFQDAIRRSYYAQMCEQYDYSASLVDARLTLERKKVRDYNILNPKDWYEHV